MSAMYSPLNTDLMFQEMEDRALRMQAGRGKDPSAWPNRRWFHRAAHRAR
jgi:hypothetical protein